MDIKPLPFKYKISLLTKQIEFINSTKKEVIYSGAYGAGKTLAICCAAVGHAKPGNEVLLCRKSRVSLVGTTLSTLLNGTGKVPPVLPPNSFVHHKSDSFIQVSGGGIIRYKGFDDEFAIRSYNFGCICVDEGIELNSTEYAELTSRLRGTHDTRQIFVATNPGNKQHVLYDRIVNHADIVDNITATIDDNPYLPKDYVADQKARYSGASYERYILGKWATKEGLCIPEFKRDLHTKCLIPKQYESYVIGMDLGWTDYTAMAIIGIDNSHYDIVDEFYANNILNKDIIEYLSKWKKYRPKVIIDPSEAEFIAELSAEGYNVDKGRNNIELGLSTLNDCFKNGMITIDVGCRNIINNLELYAYKEGTEIPEHRWSHTNDALRYAFLYLRGEKRGKELELHFSEDDTDTATPTADAMWEQQEETHF